MKSAYSDEGQQKPPRETELEGRYRGIGISAVAAAVRYQSDRKNPAYAPVPHQPRDIDAAA